MNERNLTRAAIISTCGLYRYRLSRSWANGPHLTFVMLNPSTADATEDDPTIRRCIGFARREGFAGIHVLNIFAFRATKPEALLDVADPEGPENRGYLDAAFRFSADTETPIVCAWGAHWMAAEPSRSLLRRMADLGAWATCLGTTKNGSPRHPLYVKADAPLRALTVEGGE